MNTAKISTRKELIDMLRRVEHLNPFVPIVFEVLQKICYKPVLCKFFPCIIVFVGRISKRLQVVKTSSGIMAIIGSTRSRPVQNRLIFGN